MRPRALLLLPLLFALPAQAQVTGAWGERGLATMPDGRVGNDREFEAGTRLIAISGLPTALLGYGRFSLMDTEATLLYGIPAHDWPALSLKHQLQRPTRENPTAVALSLGMLGAPARPGVPGSNLTLSLTRDVNMRRNGRDWTLFSAHLGFRSTFDLKSRLMLGLELPLGQHGAVTAEWIGPAGAESATTHFGLNLSPFPAFSFSLFSLGLPNASLLDRGLAIGLSASGVLPDWNPPKAAPAKPQPTALAPSPAPSPKATPTPKPKPTPSASPSAAPRASAPAVPVPAVPVPVAPVPVVPVPALPVVPPVSTPPVAVVPTPAVPPPAVKAPVAPAGMMIGRAVDASGKAIPGATVTLAAKGAPARTATTTPSGYFTFSGLARGAYTVTLADPAGKTLASQAVTLEGTTLEFTLKPLASERLKGRIVDAKSGQPIAGAAVVSGKERVQTDRDGYFTLDGPGAGPWNLALSAKGYAPGESRVTDLQPRLTLQPLPGTISGRIVTAAGKPVAGAIAQVGSLRAVSDSNGRYFLTDVPAGAHTLTLIQDGKALFKAPINLAPGGKVVKDAKLEEAAAVGRFGTIAGQVRDADGKPLPGVKIVVEGKAVTLLIVTDGAGRFLAQELVPGDYRLKLSRGAYADLAATAQVKAGSQASLDLTMRGR